MSEEKPMDILKQMTSIYLNNHKEVDLFKEKCINELIKFDNNSNKIDYLNNILKELIEKKTLNAKDYRFEWKIKAVKELISNYNEIAIIENKQEIKMEIKEQINSTNKIKLNWTGQKNILIYLFQQLKKEKGNNNNFLLSSSNEDIAVFLQENFNCFNDTKLSTIIGQLKKSAPPKKISKSITIHY
jgi:hypothetical protein